MAIPKIIRILNKSAIIGLAFVILSFFIPLVPCTKAPVVAEPEYAFSMCRLPNPFGEQLVGISTKYYGMFGDSLAGATLQFIIPALIFTIMFMLFRKKAAKVLDLSKK